MWKPSEGSLRSQLGLKWSHTGSSLPHAFVLALPNLKRPSAETTSSMNAPPPVLLYPSHSLPSTWSISLLNTIVLFLSLLLPSRTFHSWPCMVLIPMHVLTLLPTCKLCRIPSWHPSFVLRSPWQYLLNEWISSHHPWRSQRWSHLQKEAD